MQSVAEALANLEKTVDSPLFVALGERFTAAGHELALVGGPVRDAFLGRRSPDLDFANLAPSALASATTRSKSPPIALTNTS
jgi:poly(A) polymerase